MTTEIGISDCEPLDESSGPEREQSLGPPTGSVAPDFHPEHDAPTPESIARARAAQQRERAAFTLVTGVCVNQNGEMIRPSGALGPAATSH